MELRIRNVWGAVLLVVAVMVLGPGRAVADELEPGELKSILEGQTASHVMDAGELKGRMESFSVGVGTLDAIDPGQLKALTEARTWPTDTEIASDRAAPSSVNMTVVAMVILALLLTVGAGVALARRRGGRIAPA